MSDLAKRIEELGIRTAVGALDRYDQGSGSIDDMFRRIGNAANCLAVAKAIRAKENDHGTEKRRS